MGAMAKKKHLLSLSVDRRELAQLRQGLDLLAAKHEFTVKVQPAASRDAIAATDSLQILRALEARLEELA